MTEIGRNAPCPCGSGRKYKKCCLAADEAAARRERAEAAAAEAIADEPEVDALPEFGGNVFSPEPWKLLRKHLPKSARGELAPILEQMQELAEYETKRPEIEAAQDELEAYRDEYERLTQDPGAFMDRAEKLFAEPPFEAMRFSVAELERAFKSVDYPPSAGSAKFVAFAGRVVDFLVDDAQRTVLARRLVCLVPDYVADERYLDAWIIQHNFILVCEPPEGGCSPFLLCMFMHGLRQWRQARDRDERELFGQLGFDPGTIRQQGYEGLDALLNNAGTRQDGMEVVERFLDSHPQLAAQMQARCREAEDAAAELLQRDEGQSLLLDDAEIEPWLQPLSERIAAHPELVESALTGKKPSEQLTKVFAQVVVGVASEMTADIFTSKRLRRLRDDIEALRKRFEHDGRDESLALSGMLMAATVSTLAAESHVLNRLCLFSIMRATQNLHAAANTDH